MKLIVGNSYGVLDYHMQVEFAARFLGKATDSNRLIPIGKQLFVLEREDKHTEAWTLAGCEVRCHVDKEGEVHPYLHATHYGNTVESLAPNGVMRRDPVWKLSSSL